MACVFIRLIDANARTVLRVPHVPQDPMRPQPHEWTDIVQAHLPSLFTKQQNEEPVRDDQGKYWISIELWGRGGLSIDALAQKLIERIHQVDDLPPNDWNWPRHCQPPFPLELIFLFLFFSWAGSD